MIAFLSWLLRPMCPEHWPVIERREGRPEVRCANCNRLLGRSPAAPMLLCAAAAKPLAKGKVVP